MNELSDTRTRRLPQTPNPVPTELVGANSPSVRPGDDPAIFGSAVLEGLEIVEVRTYQTYSVRYTVGKLGLDDSGAIRIAFRMVTDAGTPQLRDATAANYVTASCSGEGRISLRVGPEGTRPWRLVVTAQLHGGYLSEGEEIVVTFGDTQYGSPGMLMQTFVEEGYELRVMADVQATGNYVPLSAQFAMGVHPGPGEFWHAVLPTLRQLNEPFTLGLKCEDRWGNPSSQAQGRVRVESSLAVTGLPESFDYVPADRTLWFDGLTVSQPGTLRLRVFVDEQLMCEAGPLLISDGDVSGYWGDLHGQTGETVGVNSIESYFDFARNKAFLDVSAHQANDFQINQAFWNKLNELTAELHEPGRFTVLPGYEWSGNTAVGGDHNVYYADEGRPIYRCSHALLEDTSQQSDDAHTLTDLYRKLADENAVVYAHVGGRYANIHYDHNPLIETAVEMHSAWGSFEWILTDGFPLRRRVGVVCNSDGHKGRPGASYPGASRFGAYGGLTCFLAGKNDRADIMEAQRRRHHYGTTGCRLHLDVAAEFASDGELFLRNPDAMPDVSRETTRRAVMGDIVKVQDSEVTLHVSVAAHAGIHSIELRDGTRVLKTVRPYTEPDLGDRVRICWSGAEYRGRGRDVSWQGRALFDLARVKNITPINAWNPETLLEQRGSQSVCWRGVTTGNFMGFDAELLGSNEGTIAITTNQGNLTVPLATIGLEAQSLDVGGLKKRLTLQRLPDAALRRELATSLKVSVHRTGDTPLWVCVTTEDGHQAWSSPIYLFRDE